ncbi:MAG: MarR family transcriptional regulator [Planctomycetes bacterium]|nr:MarR family transcriptional regulator [Planctomycetota bacterium]MBI3846612.1 MarR family transcriptional regulator [Planctomycetota bacterium]
MVKRRTQPNNVSHPAEQAFRAFVRTWGLFRNTMEPYFASFGISGAQWGVLRLLMRSEQEGARSLRLTEIGERLLVRPPSVTGLIDRLERMGLVARKPSRVDRRATEICLTPQGRRLAKRVHRRHGHQIRSVMSTFTIAETRQLHDLMLRMAAHLEKLEQTRPGHEAQR